MLTHLSLFSGIGGFDIAAEWAGFKTVCFVEIDPFCQKVLRKHWPDVPIIGDIRDVTKEALANATFNRWSRDRQAWERRYGFTDYNLLFSNECGLWQRHTECTGCRCPCHDAVDLITAGVPCQPISVAGKRRGAADDRWLWPETIRVLSEVRPTWACFENPTGILTMGFDDLLSQMEECGYETQAFIVPACAVNAPHRRDRVWIVAYNDGSCSRPSEYQVCSGGNATGLCSEDVADTTGAGLQNRRGASMGKSRRAVPEPERCNSSVNRLQAVANAISAGGLRWSTQGQETQARCNTVEGSSWWAVEPDVGRVAHGIPSRVDRLRALGNAVVPQQAYPILKAIADTYTQEEAEEP